jgi:hypothetical protein
MQTFPKSTKRLSLPRQREVSTFEDSSCGLASAMKSSSPWPAVNSIKLNNSHQSLDVYYYYGEDEKIEHACRLYLESVKRRMDQGMTLLDLSHLGESRDDSLLHSISNEDDLHVVEYDEVSSDSDYFSDDTNNDYEDSSWTDDKDKLSVTIIEPAHTLEDTFLFTTDHHGFAQDPLVVIENTTTDNDSTWSCSSSSDFSSDCSLDFFFEFPHDEDEEEATDSTHRPTGTTTTMLLRRIDSAYSIELELD